MTLAEIRKLLEQRRYNLIRTLENGRDDIELSKQHQMYGAIKELETILRTIDHYRELEIEKNTKYDFTLSNEQEKSVIEKLTLRFKKKEMTTQELARIQ